MIRPIWDSEIPDTIAVEHRKRKETRIITNYLYNNSRIPVVAWESDHLSGVCMVDVWKKWCSTGVDKS